jgi:hypothetical protein
LHWWFIFNKQQYLLENEGVYLIRKRILGRYNWYQETQTRHIVGLKNTLMKKLIQNLTTIIMLLGITIGLAAQTEGKLPDGITQATRSGDAVELASYFNNKIELVLPSKSGVFSKEQAQFLLKDFFENYPPSSFQIIHQGIRENATFAIGRYNHSKGQFRILFLTKNSGTQTLIHQLRVEKQDE